jgi:hypothetical protein
MHTSSSASSSDRRQRSTTCDSTTTSVRLHPVHKPLRKLERCRLQTARFCTLVATFSFAFAPQTTSCKPASNSGTSRQEYTSWSKKSKNRFNVFDRWCCYLCTSNHTGCLARSRVHLSADCTCQVLTGRTTLGLRVMVVVWCC